MNYPHINPKQQKVRHKCMRKMLAVFSLSVLMTGLATAEKDNQGVQTQWINGLLNGKDMSVLSADYANMLGDQEKIDYPKSNPLVSYKQAEQAFIADLNQLLNHTGKFAQKHQDYLDQKFEILESKFAQVEHWYGSFSGNNKQLKSEALGFSTQLPEELSNRWSLIKQTMQQPIASWGGVTRAGMKWVTQSKSDSWVETEIQPIILRNDRLPYNSRNFSAPELLYSPNITPSYARNTPAAVVPADLLTDDVVQLTPEIYQTAASLEYDYIKIYNFVRQQINEQYYAGSMKGSQATLLSYAGNDVDQAALLIALLRASNIPARFVQGVVEVPMDEAVKGLGLTSSDQVLKALDRAGIAHDLVIEGGQVSKIHKKYTWVSAYIPYAHYRGSANDLSGPMWIPLAPALKNHSITPGSFDYANLDLDEAQWINDYLLGAPTTSNISPMDFWRDQVQQHHNADIQDELQEVENQTESLSILPASLPFTVVVVNQEAAGLQTEDIHTIKLEINQSGGVITQLQLPMSQVAGRRLTLSYLPATVDDLNLINQAGGMSQVPPYLVDLRPVFKLDGQQITTDSQILSMGSLHQLNITLVSPLGEVDLERNLLAGTYVSLVLGIQDDEYPLNWEGVNSASDETKPIRLIHNLGVNYHKQWYLAENELAHVMGHAVIRPLPSLSILAPVFKLESLDGLPIRMQFTGVSLDAISRTADVVSRSGQDEANWMRLAALQGSWLEAEVFDSQWALNAISADQGLRSQAANGDTIHLLDSNNIHAILPSTAHPEYVKQQIQSWVNRGYEAWVPQNLTTQQVWIGSTWHIVDPQTGNSGYFIAGGYAGGQTSESPEGWSLSELSAMLMAPYGEGSNEDPLSAREIKVVESSNYQVGMVGEMLEQPTQVLVTDFINRPVAGALVTFQLQSDDHTLITDTDSSNSQVKVTTNSQGIASVDVELGQKIVDYSLVLMDPADEFATKVGQARILASVSTNVGELYAHDVIRHTVLPGPAARIEVIDCNVYSWDCDLFTYFGILAGTMHTRVVDQYDNFVSNVPYTIDAQPSLVLAPAAKFDPVTKKVVDGQEGEAGSEHSASPKSTDTYPYFDSALIALESTCDGLPSLTPPDCASQSQTMVSGPAWDTFQLYAGSMENYPNQIRNFPLTFNANGLAEENASVFARRYSPFNQFIFNGIIQTGPYGNYITAEPGTQIDLHASFVEQIFSTSLGYYVRKFYPPNTAVPGRIGYEIINETLSGGATQEMLINDSGFDTRRVQMGSEHERNQFKTTLKSNDNGNTFTAVVFTYADAAKIELAGMTPARITLTDDHLLAHDLKLNALITPNQYRAINIRFNLYKDNELIDSSLTPQFGGFEFDITLPAGFPIDPESVYEVEFIINEGTIYEVNSGRQSITDFSVRLVNAVTTGSGVNHFSNGSNGGRVYLGQIKSPLSVFKNVDLVNALVCGYEELNIDILNESQVTVDLQPLDQSGLPNGNPINLVTDQLMPAGENTITVDPAELGSHTYQIQIQANSTQTADQEIITGTLVSNYDIDNSLPIGHAVVKGVDLSDGSMVYSKQDITLAAPGSDLEFTRTYASQSRNKMTVLGNGWTHNYLSRVIVGPCGQVTVTGADAGSARFQIQGDEFIPLKGYHSSLVFNEDGTFDFYPKGGNRYHYVQMQTNVWWMDFIEDPNGNRLTIELQPREVTPIITSVTDSVGRKLVFDYEIRDLGLFNSEMLVSVSGPEGIHLTFDYDDIGNLISAQREGQGIGGSTNETLTYSGEIYGPSRALLTQVTDLATSATRTWQYQQKNFDVPPAVGDIPDIISIEVFSIAESDAGSTEFTYTPAPGYNSAASVNQNGQVSDYQLNAHGAATQITSPAGIRSFVWETGADVLLLSETDENNRLRSFEYDEYGNVREERLGSLISTYTYVAPDQFDPPYIKDRIKTHTNWRGDTTTYTYDLAGNKESEELEQITMSYDYNSQGLVTIMTDGRGLITQFTYDGWGQQKSVRNPAGDITHAEWNARGQKLNETDGNGNTTIYTYDASDRVLTKTLNDRLWTYTYQNGGRNRTETDPNNHTTSYLYDTQGRLLETTNASTNTFTYTYDLNGNKESEDDFAGNLTTFTYDDANRLRVKTESLGKVTTYTYDNVGNVLSETTADRVTEYGYDPDRYFQTSITRKSSSGDAIITRTVDGHGNVLTETDPNLNEATYTYDAFDRMLTMSGPLDSGQIMTYDGNGNVKTETVLNSTGNQVTTKTYDLANRLKQVTLPEGGTITYNYDGNGNITSETKPNGYFAVYDYNDLNLPILKTINQQTWQLSYDLAGNLKTETWPAINGSSNVVTYDYDELNREINKTDTIGQIQSQTYDANSNVKTMTDGNGNTTTYDYNALDQRILEDKPLGRGHSYTYTVFDELLTDTGPNGTITHQVDQLGRRFDSSGPDQYHMAYGYDLNGNLTSQTDSRNITTTFLVNALNQTYEQTTGDFVMTMTHDTLGNLLTQTDYRGIQSVFTYDKDNRQTTFMRAGQLQTTTTYNNAGLPISEKDARGNTTIHEYNTQYFRTRTVLPESQVIGFTPNAFGDVEFQDNPGANDITKTYDLRRRLKTETNGAGETTRYEYDLNNNRTAVIKPGGQRWEYDFDAANRLTHVRNVPESIETIYAYDTADNLETITDAELKVTSFTYDNRNRKKSKTYPGNTDVVSYDYDENGNLDLITYPNGVIATFGYDDLNRQTSQNHSGTYGTASVTMTLDGNGNIETVTENIDGSTHNYTMSYDDLDRMESQTDRYGNTFFYTYDANGNRKQFRDHDNKVTTYDYDGLNRLERLTHVGLGEVEYNYNSAGLRDLITYPNGSTVEYLYKQSNRIDTINNKQSGVIVTSHAYDYDLNGNRVMLTESNINASQVTTYAYDDADRLVQTNYPSYISTLTLDKVGNRIQEVVDDPVNNANDNTLTYTYNPRDQLTSVTDTQANETTYDYDQAGNQTEISKNGEITTLTYSPRQRVESITQGPSPVTNYEYDYNGFRVQKESGGLTRRYLFDDQAMTAETNFIGNTIARYHYSDRAIFAETRAGQNAFYLQDALRTTVALTNQDGSVQVRYNYDVWGNRNNQTGSSDQPFGFTGYQLDETGLYYAQQRYYDPVTARFNREDPLEGRPMTPPSLHRYLYASANPTVYIDPDGRNSQSIEKYSYFQKFKNSILGDSDSSGKRSEEASIRLEMEKMRISEEGIPKSNQNQEPNFTIIDMMDSIEKSKNQKMMRVAESSTNKLLLELNISKTEVIKRAHLANCVYNPKCNVIDKSVGNITRLNESELKQLGISQKELIGNWSGFKSGIFKDHDTNELIFAFAGTDDLLGDMYNNIAQGAGISSYQYDLARELAVKAARGANKLGMEISFTGHSLGGGLASFASMVTGKNGMTFNAAGLNIITALKGLYAEGLIDDNGNIVDRRSAFHEYIDAFFVQGEFLSRGQDSVPLVLPNAVGRRIELQRGSTAWSLGQHGSVNVCRSFGSPCDYSGEK